MFGLIIPSDSDTTLNFFLKHISKQARSTVVTADETLYAASILAHYAQTSRYANAMPIFLTLTDVFDNFVLNDLVNDDPDIMETAGSASLVLAGFFRDQMRLRYNVRWYDDLGARFYSRAGKFYKDARHSEIMKRMSCNFQVWTNICCRASRTIRESRYLLSA